MSAPDPIQVLAAARTLSAAGWSITCPALDRLRAVSISQAAEALGFDRRKMASLVERGEFPGARRVDDDIRIPVSDLAAWWDRQPAAASFSALKAA